MADPVTIEDFLRLVDEAYVKFTAALAALPDAKLTEPGTLGEWSARDVIAHVGGDERWMAGQLEALQAGEKPTAMSCYGSDAPLADETMLYTQDGRNAWQRERLKGLSLDEARAMAAGSHTRLLAAIRAFSDADLTTELAIADNGTAGWIRRPQAGESGWALSAWLRGVTYQHYAEHTGEILALSRSS
jgi:uncharacterized protein (TIGR03083 family)